MATTCAEPLTTQQLSVEELQSLADAHGRVHGYAVFNHVKTGTLYGLVGLAKNCTNANNGQSMVLYSSLTDKPVHPLFTREITEFLEKFHYIGETESIEAVHHEFMKSNEENPATENVEAAGLQTVREAFPEPAGTRQLTHGESQALATSLAGSETYSMNREPNREPSSQMRKQNPA